MLITVGAYTTLVATLRTSARIFSPRSACGRYSVLPEGLLGALPGHGQSIGRSLQGASNIIPDGRTTSNGPVVVGGAVLDCVIHIEDEQLKVFRKVLVQIIVSTFIIDIP
ncbi:Protein of unknown function [Gryllus bimaculatus]|nr:Protein of unknown function [Gryllus bimaculatus]